jgi:hypothetical protein
MPRLPALALVAALVAGCAFSVDGELPAVTVTYEDLKIPPAPPAVDGAEHSITLPFTMDRPKLRLPRDAFHEVYAFGMSMTAKAGVSDLSFIRTLRVTLTSPERQREGLPPFEIARYERDEGGDLVGPILKATALMPADITPAFGASVHQLGLEATGHMPGTPWLADLSFFLGAKVSY